VRHLPNIICVLRIALVWPIAAALADREYLLALALFIVAGLSDGIDGYLAKRFNWISELGKLLDPLADKLLLVTVFVEAAWLGLAPWWLTSAVVARDVLIVLGAMVYRLWFGPLRGRPTISSKINTAMQLLYVMAMLVNTAMTFRRPEVLDALAHEVLDALAILVFMTTVFSGLNYMAVFTRRAWAAPVSSS
jgi:cardiolipin synthase (CMP-forming)